MQRLFCNALIRAVLYTGMTRGGVFLIENGKVTRAVRNFLFNESPVAMLNNLVALRHSERISPSESGSAGGWSGDRAVPENKNEGPAQDPSSFQSAARIRTTMS